MIFWNIIASSSWLRWRNKCECCVKMKTPINMVCLWDSNTELCTWFTQALRYPDLLQTNHINDNLIVFNEWISGARITELLPILSTRLYPKRVEWKKNIATILIWTNDFWNLESVDLVWSQMQTLISEIKVNGWEARVMTYFPKWLDITRNISIRAFNELIKNNALNLWYIVLDIYQDFVDPNNQDIAKSWLLQSDNLHITVSWNYVIMNKLQLLLFN